MLGGGTDYEGEMAAARLRMRREQEAGSPAEVQRLRQAEADEQLLGRLLVLALVAGLFVLLRLFS